MIEKEILKLIGTSNSKLSSNLYFTNKNELLKKLGNNNSKLSFLNLVNFKNKKDELNFKKLQKNFILHNLILKDSLIKLIDAFNSYNVEYCFFKGASLAFQVYDHPFHRRMGDIDVLIKQSDKNYYESLLSLNLNPQFSINHDYYSSKYNHTIESIKINEHLNLDIHARVTNPRHYLQCPLTIYNFKKSVALKDLHNGLFSSNVISFFNSLYNAFKKNAFSNHNYIIDLIKLSKHIDLSSPELDAYSKNFMLEKELSISRELIEYLYSNNLDNTHLNELIRASFDNKNNEKIEIKWKLKNYFTNSTNLVIEKYGKRAEKKIIFYKLKFYYKKLIKFFDFLFK